MSHVNIATCDGKSFRVTGVSKLYEPKSLLLEYGYIQRSVLFFCRSLSSCSFKKSASAFAFMAQMKLNKPLRCESHTGPWCVV